jgi:ABC-type transport system substrate-binding protein
VLVVANEFGPNIAGHPHRGRQPPQLRRELGLLRPADDLRPQDPARRPRGLYDRDKLEPELAESWKMAPDGNSVTFKLRKNAKFHDGTPVTAKDVKWSFDRAVTVGGFPTFQMAAGSLEKPEQFEVVDEHTFR